MAGMPARRQRREAGTPSLAYHQYLQGARDKIASSLPILTDKMLDLATGIYVEEKVKGKDGEEVRRVYSRIPDGKMLMYLTDRVMGSPRTETNEAQDRLDTARAVYLEEQVLLGLIAAQKRELEARSGKAEMELSMWPKQFVTEEEQMADIQALAKAVNTGWLSMTPEKFAEICPGVEDPSGALERLRGLVGREQAQIIGQVLGSRAEKPTGEEEEDGEED